MLVAVAVTVYVAVRVGVIDEVGETEADSVCVAERDAVTVSEEDKDALRVSVLVAEIVGVFEEVKPCAPASNARNRHTQSVTMRAGGRRRAPRQSRAMRRPANRKS